MSNCFKALTNLSDVLPKSLYSFISTNNFNGFNIYIARKRYSSKR